MFTAVTWLLTTPRYQWHTYSCLYFFKALHNMLVSTLHLSNDGQFAPFGMEVLLCQQLVCFDKRCWYLRESIHICGDERRGHGLVSYTAPTCLNNTETFSYFGRCLIRPYQIIFMIYGSIVGRG